jgi:malonyl-CoA O-methyltransferase
MIQSTLNKKRIAQSFRKSLDTYNQHAIVQDRICSKLMHALIDHCGTEFQQTLEIGAGTGLLTAKLLEQCSIQKLIINDLVAETVGNISMLCQGHSSTEVEFIMGDAEKLQFKAFNNLIISASTVQWFENLPSFFDTMREILTTNGIFAFTTFGMYNMKEITSIEGNTLSYSPLSDLRNILAEKFEILWMMEEQIPLHFSSPKEILQHIKRTGVNGIESTRWTKNDLIQFSTAYDKFFTIDKGYSLTYHPVYAICKNK